MRYIELLKHSKIRGVLMRIVLTVVVISCFANINEATAQSNTNPINTNPVRQKSAVQQHLETLGNVVKLVDGRGQGSREIMLRWTQSADTQAQTQVNRPALQVMRQINRRDSVPKQRSAEIAPGQFLVTVSDRQGVVRYTSVISDPRITIAEYVDASGKMNRKPDIINNDVQLEVSVPENVEVSEIRIYRANYFSDNKLSLTQVVSSVVSGAMQ